jgi:hypothetical protein
VSSFPILFLSQYLHKIGSISGSDMSNSIRTRIPRCNPPQTYVHLAHQLRHPVSATRYAAWNAGKNQHSKGVLGHRPKAQERIMLSPRYIQPPLAITESSKAEMFFHRKLGGFQTLCGLSLFVSWFWLAVNLVTTLNSYRKSATGGRFDLMNISRS